MTRLFQAVSLLLAVLLAAGGCGGRYASVSGKVTYRGRTVTSGSVLLKSADDERVEAAPILPDGTYRLRRAPLGQVGVGVDNPPPSRPAVARAALDPSEAAEVREAAAQARNFVAVPPRYRDPGSSGITTTLKGGENTFDIALP
jgi:hypothetical protein